MADCIFCKIAAGEIPSQCVYEDDFVFAFRDIAPQAPVHILIIPKEHIASSIADITAENSLIAAKCLEAAAKLAEREGLGDGFRLITNSGHHGGQTVFHLHFHLMGGRPLGAMLV